MSFPLSPLLYASIWWISYFLCWLHRLFGDHWDMKSSVKKKDVRLTNICFNYDATNDSTFYVLLLYSSPATFFWHYTLDTDRWTLTFWERVNIAYFFCCCCYLVAHKRRCSVRRKVELLINRLYVFSAFSYIHHTTSLSTMSLFKLQCATRLNFIVTYLG